MQVPSAFCAAVTAAAWLSSAGTAAQETADTAVGRLAPSTSVAPRTIAGVVYDIASGSVIASAQVTLVGTKFGAITDASGRFEIKADPGEYVMMAQSIGYSPGNVSVVVYADRGVAAAIGILQFPVPVCGLMLCLISCSAVELSIRDAITTEAPSVPVTIRVLDPTGDVVEEVQSPHAPGEHALEVGVPPRSRQPGPLQIELKAAGYHDWHGEAFTDGCGWPRPKPLHVWLLPR